METALDCSRWHIELLCKPCTTRLCNSFDVYHQVFDACIPHKFNWSRIKVKSWEGNNPITLFFGQEKCWRRYLKKNVEEDIWTLFTVLCSDWFYYLSAQAIHFSLNHSNYSRAMVVNMTLFFLHLSPKYEWILGNFLAKYWFWHFLRHLLYNGNSIKVFLEAPALECTLGLQIFF